MEASPAERRQLTVLFCDLVAWPSLAGKLDLESLQKVMRTEDFATPDRVAGESLLGELS